MPATPRGKWKVIKRENMQKKSFTSEINTFHFQKRKVKMAKKT
jgi:hypothetical protein